MKSLFALRDMLRALKPSGGGRNSMALTVVPVSRAVKAFPVESGGVAVATRAPDTGGASGATFTGFGTASPGDNGLLAALRRNGVRRIYGVFDGDAWAATCRAAFLYRLPLSGNIPCETRGLMAQADHDAAYADDWYWHSGKKPVLTMLWKNMADTGHIDLIRTLFPNGEAVEGGDTSIEIVFPRPPQALLPTLHRAGLAGLHLHVAVPATAIRLPKVERWKQAAARRVQYDPIIYGVHQKTQQVVVLGYYNCSSSDPVSLRTLVDVLKSRATDLW